MIVSVSDLIHGSWRAHSDISNLYMTICTAKWDLMLTTLHLLISFFFLSFFLGGGGWGGRGDACTMCSMQSQKSLCLHEEKLSLLKIKRTSCLQYIQCSKQPVWILSLWKLKLFILWYIRSGQPQMHGYTQGSRLTVNYLSSFSQLECCK